MLIEIYDIYLKTDILTKNQQLKDMINGLKS